MCVLSSTQIAQVLPTYGAVVAVTVLALQVLVIISIVRGSDSVGHKVLWTALVLLLPIIGLILYALFGRSPRDRPLPE
jgi:hypothetical protein